MSRGQVVPANLPGHQPAGPAAECSGDQGNSTGYSPATPRNRRCGSGWKCITPIRSCATCHQIFEPMGMALENFDAVGMWRTEDSGSADRRVGATCRRDEDRRVGQPARPADELFRSVRPQRYRETADVCAWPRRRISRHAAGEEDHAGLGPQTTTGSRHS